MKTVTVKLAPFEEKMLLLLRSKYNGPPNLSQTIRRAFVNECIRYGFDRKVLEQVLAEANA